MDANLLNISNIEEFFDNLMSKDFPNIFFTNLPYAMEEGWKDIVLVDFADSIMDLWGCGRGFANVFLYTKPLSTGIENSKDLGVMESTFNKLISNSHDKHYHISRFRSGGGYDEVRNLHFRIVTVIIQIV